MTSEDLILAALEQAHSDSPEVTQALAAIIVNHEKVTGERLDASRLQLRVNIDKTENGMAFNLSLIVTPDKVIPFRKVVAGVGI